MKKWLISILAAGVALLASTAFADGSITLSPDGSTSTDASVRIDGQTVTITQAGIDLKEKAAPLIDKLNGQLGLSAAEANQLAQLLRTVLRTLNA